MRRILSLLILLLIACRAFSPMPGVSSPPAVEGDGASPATLTPPVVLAMPQARGAQHLFQPTPGAIKVRAHPDGALYAGDKVSLEVIAPGDTDLSGESVQLEAPGADGPQTSREEFWPHGIGGRVQANFLWAWDTIGMESGAYELRFNLLPDGPSWTETLLLQSQEGLPASGAGGGWAVADSECCRIHYITGTSVARDLPALLEMVDGQMESAIRKMGLEPKERIEITFLSRVLGHGGFARDGLSVSYLDRHYAGGSTSTVLHHELVHAIDVEMTMGAEGGPALRPLIFIEGLAVYLTGGHFKPEPLAPRAAALLPPEVGCRQDPKRVCGLGWYIPLTRLVEDFYQEQHEIGYLQAGALVEFMVENWGWEAFFEFYRDIHQGRDSGEGVGSPYQAIDRATSAHFDLSLDELEARFLEALRQEKLHDKWVQDVRLSVEFYETVRRYQMLLDPSAHFLSAWLPDGVQMRTQGIVADYMRRPSEVENLAIESMLVRADAHLRDGDYRGAAALLEAMDVVLSLYPREGLAAFSAHELAADYLALVQVTLTHGYQPQKIWIDRDSARIWATTGTAHAGEISELVAVRQRGDWFLELITGN